MAEVVISEFMDDDAVAALAEDFHVLYDPGLVDRRDDLLAALADCRALVVRNRTRVDKSVLAAAPGLRVVGRLGVGLDNIDQAACAARGVQVAPATGANVAAVAEYVVTGVLMLLRGAYQASGAVLDGTWPRNALMGREVNGKTLGLVGLGGIGRAVAPRARALGMSLIGTDPGLPDDHAAWAGSGVSPVTLDRLLAHSDAVSLHVPLTSETRHMLDAAALSRMRAGAVLVNASRGGVVDEAALAAALRDGHLAGALLDVFECEPLPGASVLRGVPNLVVTPHIAGVTAESNVRVSALTAENVRRALAAG